LPEIRKQELVTPQQLSGVELRELSKKIPDLFGSWGETSVRVMYGWACNLPIDELWKPRAIQLSALSDFIHNSERDGVFVVGESDLFIFDDQETTYFQLCHERDMHFVTADQRRLESVIESWKRSGLTLSRADGQSHLAKYEEVQHPNRDWVEV
jgi:hypothetical protein